MNEKLTLVTELAGVGTCTRNSEAWGREEGSDCSLHIVVGHGSRQRFVASLSRVEGRLQFSRSNELRSVLAGLEYDVRGVIRGFKGRG